MRDRPMLMCGEMVVATLEDRKTQTRRVVNPQPFSVVQSGGRKYDGGIKLRPSDPCYSTWNDACPYGPPGTHLWLRETWAIGDGGGRLVDPCINYRADGGQKPLVGHASTDTWSIAGNSHEVNNADLLKVKRGWRSGRFMPRWASRLTLEIVSVRVERLQEISEADAMAEGITWPDRDGKPYRPPIDTTGMSSLRYAADRYRELWDSLNGKTFPWSSNPWVWRIEFKRL